MSKIAIICGAGTVSGKEIMALELANAARKEGHQVEFVVSVWGSSEFRHRVQELGFEVQVMPLGFISATLTWKCIRMTLHQLIFWPSLLTGYSRFLSSKKPDRVIHTNWHHLLLLRQLLKRERDIFWLHEVIPSKRHYRWIFHKLSSKLRKFIVVSHVVAKSLDKLGISPLQIRLVYNGITSPAAPEPSESGNRVGIVGQVEPWKGHGDLLLAFAQVARRFPAAELHVFGKGSEDYRDFLQEQATRLGIEEKVLWHGFVSDPEKIYSAIDVCVIPSRSQDPLPTSAIEAAHYGRAIIASQNGGLPEIVQDGRTGLLFESGNISALARCLSELLSKEKLRRQFGKRAREDALERFSQKRFVEEFLSAVQL